MATYIEINAEIVAEHGPLREGEGYTACIYCGSPEVCCGSPRDACHCPECHERDLREGEWASCRTCRLDDAFDADVPPEADGDSEDPMISPRALFALI